MEISDDQSKFQTVSDESFVFRDDPFASSGDQSFRYAFGANEERGEKLFSDILSLFYRSLDALSGRKSYMFLRDNFVAPDFPRPYRNILALLKRHKMVGVCNLRPERLNSVPFFYKFNCLGAHPKNSTDGKTGISMLHALGISKDRNEAASKMIGEFCERYFLTLYKDKNLLRSSVGALKKKHIPALDLDLLAGFSEKQKEERSKLRWNDESVFRWEKCFRVLSGEPTYIPADLIYWNYRSDVESGEPTLREHNTSGCGGFFTKEGAILSGLYELVQRDAFLYWYLNTLTPPKIDPESVSDETFRLILEESKRYGIAVHCLNTTIDTQIPSVAVILEDRLNSGPHFVMGAGCGANPARAARRAMEEAWSIYIWAAQSAHYPKFLLAESYTPFCAMDIGQSERTALFANPLMRPHYEFLIHGVEKKIGAFDFSYPPDFSSEREELSVAVKHLERLGKGYEIYAFLPDHILLSKLGYVSARVIVPRLIPLYLHEANAPLGSERLRIHHSKMGIAQARTPNSWPHPFP
ncbi:MAG: YcaO-like family protein [Patescibacteria group bacterium]